MRAILEILVMTTLVLSTLVGVSEAGYVSRISVSGNVYGLQQFDEYVLRIYEDGENTVSFGLLGLDCEGMDYLISYEYGGLDYGIIGRLEDDWCSGNVFLGSCSDEGCVYHEPSVVVVEVGDFSSELEL